MQKIPGPDSGLRATTEHFPVLTSTWQVWYTTQNARGVWGRLIQSRYEPDQDLKDLLNAMLLPDHFEDFFWT
jgi:hypothetical protein